MRIRKQAFLFISLVALIIGALALAGCAKTPEKQAAAKVNDKVITIAVLDAEMAKLKLQNPNIFDTKQGGMDESEVRKSMLDELINQELLTAKATADGIKVTDAEITKQIDALKSGYSDSKQFDEALKSAGFTLESLKESYRWQILSSELLNKIVPTSSVTDTDIKKYYNDNKQMMRVEAAKRASHILFETKDKATADKVLAELKGGADFATLATKYSKDTASAKSGGDLGWPTAPYVATFQKALDKLDKGELSALVKTEYGYHIITVTDERKAGTASLDDKKDEIRQTLVNQKRSEAYQTLLTELRKAAKIEILDPKVLAATKSAATTTSGTEATKPTGK